MSFQNTITVKIQNIDSYFIIGSEKYTMKILIFDTETTSLLLGNICQLAYLIMDNGMIKSKNFYFNVKFIEQEAQNIHGFTVESLKILSKNKNFYEYYGEIKSDFENVDLVISHNYEFDMKFLITEFCRCKQRIRCSRGFCTMKYFATICKLKGKNKGHRFPKLEELVNYFEISEREIIKKVLEIFEISNLGFHDARFDVIAIWLCYLKAIKLGYVNKLIFNGR